MEMVLSILALVFVFIALVESKGKAWAAWAVLMLVLLHLPALLGRLPK